jgi:hypothetical protein
MSFLDNYEDVAARIARLWVTHPTARVQTNIVGLCPYPSPDLPRIRRHQSIGHRLRIRQRGDL